MGRAEKKSYADLGTHLADPSNWPEGPEGEAARTTFLRGMDHFTAGAVDRKDAEAKVGKYLGIVSSVLNGVPGIADLAKLAGI